jgi:natural product precursor
MKQIKKIVLRDATKLTNSEMKSIRGGYEPDRFDDSCSATCNINSSITYTCYGHNVKCRPFVGTGIACYYPDTNNQIIERFCEKDDIIPPIE